MMKNYVLVVLTFVISCNGFFWTSAQQQNSVPQGLQPQPSEGQPQYRQVPMSYFRTYTYQPMTFPSQPVPVPVQTYQVSSRLLPNGVPQSWQRQMPMSQPSGPFFPQPQQPQQLQPPMSSMGPGPQQSNPHPSHGPMSPQAPGTSQPMMSAPEFQPQPQQPQPQVMTTPYSAAPSYRPQPQFGGNTMALDMMANMPSMNFQQLQFVPCMCPVAVTISAQPAEIVEKRSDEIQSESSDSLSVVPAPEDKV